MRLQRKGATRFRCDPHRTPLASATATRCARFINGCVDVRRLRYSVCPQRESQRREFFEMFAKLPTIHDAHVGGAEATWCAERQVPLAPCSVQRAPEPTAEPVALPDQLVTRRSEYCPPIHSDSVKSSPHRTAPHRIAVCRAVVVVGPQYPDLPTCLPRPPVKCCCSTSKRATCCIFRRAAWSLGATARSTSHTTASATARSAQSRRRCRWPSTRASISTSRTTLSPTKRACMRS